MEGEPWKDNTLFSPLILTFPDPIAIDFMIQMLLLYVFYVISCGFVITLQWDISKPGTFQCISVAKQAGSSSWLPPFV